MCDSGQNLLLAVVHFPYTSMQYSGSPTDVDDCGWLDNSYHAMVLEKCTYGLKPGNEGSRRKTGAIRVHQSFPCFVLPGVSSGDGLLCPVILVRADQQILTKQRR
jgi:hypothetical protein